MTEKIELTSRPNRTVTRIWLEGGQLKVEYYDFSKEAHTFFGNDIAWTITVHNMDTLYSTVNKNETSLIS
jgi:hypothetical protein